MLHCTDVFSVFSDGKEPTGSYTLHPHYGAILEKPSVNNYIGFFLWSFKVNRIQGAALCQECCTNEDKLYSNQVSPLLIPCYSALFFFPPPLLLFVSNLKLQKKHGVECFSSGACYSY